MNAICSKCEGSEHEYNLNRAGECETCQIELAEAMNNDVKMNTTNKFLETLKYDIAIVLSTPVVSMAEDTGQSCSMVKATDAMSHIAEVSDVNWELFVKNLTPEDLKELEYALSVRK